MDNAEKKRDGTGLGQSEQLFAGIINFLPDATFVIDSNGIVIAWNRAIEEMTGIPAEKILGKGNHEYAIPFYGNCRPILIDLVFVSDDELEKNYYHIIRKEGDTIIAETDLPRPLGNIVHLWGKASPLYDEKGNKVGAIESIRDITDRKQAELALKESEVKYRTLFENSGSPLMIIDEDTTILLVNREFENVSGYTRDEIDGRKSWTEFIATKEDLAMMEKYHRLRRVSPELAPVTYESRLLNRKGDILNVIMTVVMVPGTRQSLAALIDITGRKKAEIDLQNAKEFAENIIETANAIIVGLDNEGRITIFNQAAERITGYTCADMEGRNWFEVIVPKDRFSYVHEEFSRLMAGGIPRRFENPILTKTGEVRFIAWQNNEIREQGRVTGTISIGIDITDRRRVEDELRTLYADLEKRVAKRTADLRLAEEGSRRANEKLNLLSSITRHDIVNQIIALNGFLELSLKKVTDETEQDYIQKARRAAATIERHILFTRLYQDIGVKSPAWQNVRVCAEKQVADILPAPVSFTTDLDEIEIYTDPLFEKALFTLIDNTLRHGERVTAIRFSYQIAETGALLLLYEDNGVGIRAEDKERIFERGFGKNTGFGLFLAREILAITGITIRETGEENKGARFEITVPEGAWRNRGERD